MRGSGLPRLSFLHSTWYLLTYRTVHTDPLGVLCDGVRRLVRWYTDKDKANARHYWNGRRQCVWCDLISGVIVDEERWHALIVNYRGHVASPAYSSLLGVGATLRRAAWWDKTWWRNLTGYLDMYITIGSMYHGMFVWTWHVCIHLSQPYSCLERVSNKNRWTPPLTSQILSTAISLALSHRKTEWCKARHVWHRSCTLYKIQSVSTYSSTVSHSTIKPKTMWQRLLTTSDFLLYLTRKRRITYMLYLGIDLCTFLLVPLVHTMYIHCQTCASSVPLSASDWRARATGPVIR